MDVANRLRVLLSGFRIQAWVQIFLFFTQSEFVPLLLCTGINLRFVVPSPCFKAVTWKAVTQNRVGGRKEIYRLQLYTT